MKINKEKINSQARNWLRETELFLWGKWHHTHSRRRERERILYIYTDFHHLVCQRNLKTRPKIFTQKSFHLLEALSGLPTWSQEKHCGLLVAVTSWDWLTNRKAETRLSRDLVFSWWEHSESSESRRHPRKSAAKTEWTDYLLPGKVPLLSLSKGPLPALPLPPPAWPCASETCCIFSKNSLVSKFSKFSKSFLYLVDQDCIFF